MRYRKLDANGDYSFGASAQNFYVNQPEAVAQAVVTRLQLYLGEWFLDTTDGTDWNNQILGKYTTTTRDAELQARILDTPGVSGITGYNSYFDRDSRNLKVIVAISTIYGNVAFELAATAAPVFPGTNTKSTYTLDFYSKINSAYTAIV